MEAFCSTFCVRCFNSALRRYCPRPLWPFRSERAGVYFWIKITKERKFSEQTFGHLVNQIRVAGTHPNSPESQAMSVNLPPQEDGSKSKSKTPANVQIYDRPERKGLTPQLIALIVVILIVLAVILYKVFVH